jgi:uncharacterized protein (DUF1697 family)
LKVGGSGRQRTAGAHVALLRGINVGGKHLLPMKDLAAMFSDAGCREVSTYIQSGNVVFQAEPALVLRLPSLIGRAVQARFGFEAPILTRSVTELGVIAGRNPYLARGADLKALHVAFLMDHPNRADLAALDPHRSPPDEFTVRGREIYVHCPNGMGRSKLTAQYFDSTLKTTSTARNWNTVLKLLELARAA